MKLLLKHVVLALLLVSSLQFLMLKMQVMKLANSTLINGEAMIGLRDRVDVLEKSGDPYILEMEESIAVMTQEINKLRESAHYLMEHADQTDQKMEVMEQFRTSMETSSDISI